MGNPRLPSDSSTNTVGHGRGRILVVDDHEDAADLLSFALSREGYEVRVAPDGVTSLELYGTFAPDLVVLDIGLPDMSGFDVAERMRSDGYRVPLVALSGRASPADKKRADAIGFDRYLVKPIAPGVIVDAVAAALAERAAR